VGFQNTKNQISSMNGRVLADVADGVAAQDAATVAQATAGVAGALLKTGGTMSGDINMGTKNITNAGRFTGDVTGNLTGNASTSTTCPSGTSTGTNTGDQDLSGKANLASPTFSGTPSLPTGTTGVTQSAADSSTKLATTLYADTADNLRLPKTGGTMSGAIAMGANKITGLAAGSAAGDALKCSQSGPSCIGWGNGAQGTYLTATTYTFDPWNSTLAANSTATGTKKFLCPVAGNLIAYWRIGVNGMTNGTGAASAVVTLQKNGVDTAMTVTWTPSSAADTPTLFGGGAIAVAAGDQLTLKMVPTLTNTATCVLTGLVFSGAITVA